MGQEYQVGWNFLLFPGQTFGRYFWGLGYAVTSRTAHLALAAAADPGLIQGEKA